MNKLLRFFGSQLVLKSSIFIFGLVYLVLIVINFERYGLNFHNSDFYRNHFLDYLKKGHYDSVAEGTTIIYNLFLKGLYNITGNVDSSFIILNSISQILLLVFGVWFINKIYKWEKNIYYKIVIGIYSLFIINSTYYIRAWNDFFLGVFIILLLYVMLVELFKNKNQILSFALVGALFSITLSIRPTSIVALPLIIFVLFFWFIKSEDVLIKKIRKLSLALLAFLVITGFLHYPSLKENQSLSFYDKNPKIYHRNPDIKDVTWQQRNYLGLKKVEEGIAPRNRDAVWSYTKFEEVDRYLKKHGKNSIPRTFSEFVIKDPVLLAKISVYNIFTALLRFMRFWGFLFLLVLIPFINLKKIRTNFSDIKQLPSILLVLSIVIFSIVCGTFLEFRWFAGYDILLPIAILFQINNLPIFKRVYINNLFFSTSLIIITLFNFRTIFNILDII